MTICCYRVDGVPATFATKGEKPWRAVVAASVPRQPADGRTYRVLSASFVTPTEATGRHAQDVDNLMEPVLWALVGRLGWFGGKRSNLDEWFATIQHGAKPGAEFAMADELLASRVSTVTETLAIGTYSGPLPNCATHPEACAWSEALARSLAWRPREACGLELAFASPTVNIGEIATGPVKATIDCLYPFLGGTRGHPEDQRIRTLVVRRGVADVRGTVRVRLLEHLNPEPIAPPPRAGGSHPPRPVPLVPTGKRPSGANPCRPGTRMHAVFSAALREDTVDEAIAALEASWPGSGAHLNEYLGDLRSERHVNVQILDGRIRLLA